VKLRDVEATPFQHEVWSALCDIPFGEVRTYAEVAGAVGRPRAARAVGNANHANPWPIIVPCHRVVAATGLGGYGGGERVKRYLLGLEGVSYN
jgi:O-6-methylguanine DNA methyltransferase